VDAKPRDLACFLTFDAGDRLALTGPTRWRPVVSASKARNVTSESRRRSGLIGPDLLGDRLDITLAELCPTSPRAEVAGIPVPSSVDYGDAAFRMPMPCKADGAPDDRYVQICGHRSSSGPMAATCQPCRCTVPPCTSCKATHWPGSDPSDPAPAARADATCGARHGASHLLGCCDPRPACRHLEPRCVVDDGRRRIQTTDVFLEHRFIGTGEG
jgi:hypothetical protein